LRWKIDDDEFLIEWYLWFVVVERLQVTIEQRENILNDLHNTQNSLSATQAKLGDTESSYIFTVFSIRIE
jgi:hypothetical protein